MAFTRFHDDDARISKQLQQSTDVGRYILNVPGNGSNPSYIADPHIRIQGWGGALMTNSVNLESELLGVTKRLGKDCLGENEYIKIKTHTNHVQYPTSRNLYTEESRSICPAWTFRDLEQVDWYYPQLNPQENVCLPFHNNISTRILEKDNFSPLSPNCLH